MAKKAIWISTCTERLDFLLIQIKREKTRFSKISKTDESLRNGANQQSPSKHNQSQIQEIIEVLAEWSDTCRRLFLGIGPDANFAYDARLKQKIQRHGLHPLEQWCIWLDRVGWDSAAVSSREAQNRRNANIWPRNCCTVSNELIPWYKRNWCVRSVCHWIFDCVIVNALVA